MFRVWAVLFSLLLVSCSAETEVKVSSEPPPSCEERWMDASGETHCGHTVRFQVNVVMNVSEDSVPKYQKIATRYYCMTDSVLFDLPVVPFEVAE